MAKLKWIKIANCEAPMVSNNVWLLIKKNIHTYIKLSKYGWTQMTFAVEHVFILPHKCYFVNQSKVLFLLIVNLMQMYCGINMKIWRNFVIVQCLLLLHWWMFADILVQYCPLAIVNEFLATNIFSYITLGLTSLSWDVAKGESQTMSYEFVEWVSFENN
jgi:hypothetical protein